MSHFWFSRPLESKYNINPRWKLTPPFHVPSTTIMVSFSVHPLSAVLQYKSIMLFTFIEISHKVHSHHIFTFMSLPQFSASPVIFTNWGRQGVTIPSPLKVRLSSMFLSTNMNCMYKSKQNRICLSHGILHFPCILIWAKMFPLHLELCNGLVLEWGFLSVQYALGFW
jgi:hypothetical protein